MIDRLMALLGIALLTSFCVLLVVYVGRIDLGIVIAICLIMAAFDLLYYSNRKAGKNGSD